MKHKLPRTMRKTKRQWKKDKQQELIDDSIVIYRFGSPARPVNNLTEAMAVARLYGEWKEFKNET